MNKVYVLANYISLDEPPKSWINCIDVIKDNYRNDWLDKYDFNNILNKKQGDYITISFQDITDINNFQMVLKVLEKELLRIFSLSNIKKEAKCLIIGLGNSKSTPDSLGYETVKNIIVTRHLYELGEVDKKYRNVSVLEPNVIGNTGIESRDVIMGVIKETTPDFIIAIDSLSASNIERIQKTIQITNTGIQPGSGIGNNRGELSIDTIKIPVIAIGVPTVVSSAVIVHDTINYLIKESYGNHSRTRKISEGSWCRESTSSRK